MALKYQVMSSNYVPWKHSLKMIVQILLFWTLHQKMHGLVQSAEAHLEIHSFSMLPVRLLPPFSPCPHPSSVPKPLSDFTPLIIKKYKIKLLNN